MLDATALHTRVFPLVEHSYGPKDCILYALGIGLGQGGGTPSELRATFEGHDAFAALPTMVNVLAYPGFWAKEPDAGLNWQKILHGEQSVTLHTTLPTAGTLVSQTRITGIVDKGVEKGALIYTDREITDKSTGRCIATVSSTIFARGDGGMGSTVEAKAAVRPLPDRAPDWSHEFKTSPRAALIYRLSGDHNPLHVDQKFARANGFDRPILHGLCTLGIAAWALTETLADGDYTALTHLQARFSAPVYPGETVRTEFWSEDDQIRLRAGVAERDVVVLDNGIARLSGGGAGDG
ncbi:MAG: MaoC/PaaZ C-terminal domain-containing protein [Pseudomonadota bacterium]